jgi:hypothetical protein
VADYLWGQRGAFREGFIGQGGLATRHRARSHRTRVRFLVRIKQDNYAPRRFTMGKITT